MAERRSARGDRGNGRLGESDTREGARLDPPSRRPLLDERGRTIITPNGFPLHL